MSNPQTKKGPVSRPFAYTLCFYLYLVFLTWGIVMKMDVANLAQARFDWLADPSLLLASGSEWERINWVPLAGTARVGGHLDYWELGLNVLAFIPLGYMFRLAYPRFTFQSALLPLSTISLSYEVIQYVLAIGQADITDLLTNSLGSVIGLFLHCFLIHQKTSF